MSSESQCFYCQDEMESSITYHAHFINQGEHVEKQLCKECYKDWLEGIKE